MNLNFSFLFSSPYPVFFSVCLFSFCCCLKYEIVPTFICLVFTSWQPPPVWKASLLWLDKEQPSLNEKRLFQLFSNCSCPQNRIQMMIIRLSTETRLIHGCISQTILPSFIMPSCPSVYLILVKLTQKRCNALLCTDSSVIHYIFEGTCPTIIITGPKQLCCFCTRMWAIYLYRTSSRVIHLLFPVSGRWM